MKINLEILRIIPEIELLKFGVSPISSEEFFLTLGLSEYEVPVGAVFDISIGTKDGLRVFDEALRLEEIYLFDKKIDTVPIGIRVACKFSVIQQNKEAIISEMAIDFNGYLETRSTLTANIRASPP